MHNPHDEFYKQLRVIHRRKFKQFLLEKAVKVFFIGSMMTVCFILMKKCA